jgi:predicted MFS family arabinose efflux permease
MNKNGVLNTDIKAKQNLYSIFSIQFLYQNSINVIFPIIPLLFFNSHSNFFSLQGTTSSVRSMLYSTSIILYGGTFFIMPTLFSIYSDYLGKRKTIIACELCLMPALILCGYSVAIGSIMLFFISLLCIGLFSRITPLTQAIIGELSLDFSGKFEVMGKNQFFQSLGIFVGPALGGYFAQSFLFDKLNFSLPFFIAAISSFIALLISYYLLRDNRVYKKVRVQSNKIIFLDLIYLLKKREVWRLSIVFFLFQVSWMLYYMYILPLLEKELNFQGVLLGSFVSYNSIWLMIGSIFVIKFLVRLFPPKKILIIAHYTFLCSLLLILLVLSLPDHRYLKFSIWILTAPIAVGNIVIFCELVAIYSKIVGQKDQGKIMSINIFTTGVAWLTGAIFGGFLESISDFLPIIFAPLGLIILIFMGYSFINENNDKNLNSQNSQED